MVMAEDGKKMSKSLRNYTPPDELMEAYAPMPYAFTPLTRLVKGEERLADAGVKDMVRRALLPWYNAFLRTMPPSTTGRRTRASMLVTTCWITGCYRECKP